MIELIIIIFTSLLISFLLTLQQIHFAVVVSSKNDYEKGNSVRNSIINGFLKKPKQFIESNNLAKLAFLGIYGTSAFYLFESSEIRIPFVGFEWLLYLVLAIAASVVYVALCEFLPRLFFDYKASHLSFRSILWSLLLVYLLFYPLVSILHKAADSVWRILKRRDNPILPNNTLGQASFDTNLHEISQQNSGPEMETDRKIIQNVIDFSSIRVKESMIPRTEIVAVNMQTATWNDLKEKFSESGHSRIVIYEEDIDHVTGYVHVLEMFDNDQDWRKHIKEIPFVPEIMVGHDLMHELMQKQKNIAVVVDEFGGTVGIITLEDLVEEIFGEIEDEHDKRSIIERKINDKEYIFAGRMEIGSINEKYELNLPESEDYQTLAGYLLFVNQRFPNVNQVITVNNLSFTILKMSKTKVELVKIVLNS
ncbi:MAG: hemolysin family protein [Dysgonamonadaceae bacterium]